eukprot:TRINITY_DN4700_c0_g1_i1.p1 TRINITY_DN4700_c0_g1~~TRINITY_DN4700_c0_g1_i1.p1  ORF type:complete len:171 (+),score=30.23 TRINITY_DN4700_c0_g1_i1:718-1230(+)
MRSRETCDFSFSGTKSSIASLMLTGRVKTIEEAADVAASFQRCAFKHVQERVDRALKWASKKLESVTTTDIISSSFERSLVVCGGVARNNALRGVLTDVATENGFRVVIPPPELCSDNGVMIAWAGIERLQKGLVDSTVDSNYHPRWPLDPEGPRRQIFFDSNVRSAPRK